ncbi:MAG TPA: hypothetical protein PL110_06370, partial [Candidatus Eremiobacteraeota bacterium]|nr:hypothetical protein [Candidatus Eremiobacteraeota bacterium]
GNVLAKDNLNKCGDIYLKNIKYYLEKENYKSGKLLCQKVMKFFPEGEYLEKAKNYLKIIEKKEKDKKKKTSHSEEYIIIRR